MNNEQRNQKSGESPSRSPYFHMGVLALPFLGALAIMAFSDPYTAPLVLVPVPFILLGFGVYRLTLFAAQRQGMKAARSRIFAILASGSVTLIMILKSIGQLTIHDFIIFMLLILGAIFYINRTTFTKK